MKTPINMDFFFEKRVCVNLKGLRMPFIGILTELNDKYIVVVDERYNRTSLLYLSEIAGINTLDDINARR
jgi:hypothetical protein